MRVHDVVPNVVRILLQHFLFHQPGYPSNTFPNSTFPLSSLCPPFPVLTVLEPNKQPRQQSLILVSSSLGASPSTPQYQQTTHTVPSTNNLVLFFNLAGILLPLITCGERPQGIQYLPFPLKPPGAYDASRMKSMNLARGRRQRQSGHDNSPLARTQLGGPMSE